MHTKLYNIVNILIEKERSQKEKTKLTYIKKILEDKQSFFKINAETACSIIKDLGFSKEETIEIYKELISFKNYQ